MNGNGFDVLKAKVDGDYSVFWQSFCQKPGYYRVSNCDVTLLTVNLEIGRENESPDDETVREWFHDKNLTKHYLGYAFVSGRKSLLEFHMYNKGFNKIVLASENFEFVHEAVKENLVKLGDTLDLLNAMGDIVQVDEGAEWNWKGCPRYFNNTVIRKAKAIKIYDN